MKKKTDRRAGFTRLLPRLRAYRVPMLLMLLTSGAGSMVDIGVPLFQRYALNHFVTLGSLDGLPFYVAVYLFVILLSAAFYRAACETGGAAI